jgi:hypothetical protein
MAKYHYWRFPFKNYWGNISGQKYQWTDRWNAAREENGCVTALQTLTNNS